jgi:hypothetical protein
LKIAYALRVMAGLTPDSTSSPSGGRHKYHWEEQMAQTAWHLQRYEKAATTASWSGDFTDFAQVLAFATSVFGSGKGESIRFSAPDGAPPAQVKQLVALGAQEGT